MDRSSTPASSAGTAGLRPAIGSLPPSDAVAARSGPLHADLDSFLQRVPRLGAALVVSGVAGSGRSAHLAWTTDLAARRGIGVVRVSGSRSETGLSAAVVDRLLAQLALNRPVGGTAAGIPAPVGSSAELTAGVLAAARAAARSSPVLVVVDDLPVVDRISKEVLRRLVSRLRSGQLPGVGLLAAADAGTAAGFAAPVLALAPLPATAARAVLATRFPLLAPPAVERLVREAEGNPLALVELPTTLTEDETRGLADLPPVLPLSHRLEALFGNVPARLHPATRALLVLVALGGPGAAVPMDVILGDRPPGALREALRSGLLSIDPGDSVRGVRFAHPIARLTVLAGSAAEERRAAHLWWAAREADAVRRSWHLASAHHGPDRELAASLAQAAQVHLERHEALPAIAALTRAAELDPAGRSRLLARAAYVATCHARDPARAATLLTRATEAAGPGGPPAYALMTTAHLALHADGDVGAAQRSISAALARIPREERDDLEVLARAVADAVSLDALTMRRGREEAVRAAPGRPAEVRSLRLLATLSDPAGDDVPEAAELDAAIAELADEPDAAVILRVAGAVLTVDRLNDCRPALLRIAAASGDGAVATQVTAVLLLAMGDYHAGRWDEAARRCADGLAQVVPRGDQLRAAQLRCVLMTVAASRGETEEVRRLYRDVEPWASRQGVQALVSWCRLARGLDAVARGDFEAAFGYARAVAASRPAGDAGRATWSSLDLVESALRTGRRGFAADHVREMVDDPLSRLSPRLSIVLPACRAMTSTGAVAGAFFAEALGSPALEQWPFEHARVRLAHGEWLRRARARREARAELATAMALFTELAAPAWVRRATGEHQATVNPARGPRAGGLTSQEHEVARLAASGLTNGEISARLRLSPKTVASHLSSTLRKLGINSRAALRQALGPEEKAAGHRPAPPPEHP